MRFVSVACALVAGSLGLAAVSLAENAPKPEGSSVPAASGSASMASSAGSSASATPPAQSAPAPRVKVPFSVNARNRQRPAVVPPPVATVPPASKEPEPIEGGSDRRDGFADPNAGADGKPVAGYHSGRFFLRDRYDYFRLFVGGRLHVDSNHYVGPGVADAGLKSSVVVRRARIELGGEVWGSWQWLFEAEFTPTAVDNPDGTEQHAAARAGQEPVAATARYAPVQTPQYRAQLQNVYVNYAPSLLLNLQVGQFNLPFTMENSTSSNATTFLERSLPVRAFAVPEVRDVGVMLWGGVDKSLAFWSLGLFNGDGMNRPNADNRFMTAGRVFVRPLARTRGALEKLQFGLSFKYASRDKNRVAYDVPRMSTQGNYAFWSPRFTDALGRTVHIIPCGAEAGIAAELRVPFKRFEGRSEFVYQTVRTREGVDGFQTVYSERFGAMTGWAYYLQLSYWLLGSPKVVGDPGDASPPRIDLAKADSGIPMQGLELAIKWEQLKATYASASRGGVADVGAIDGAVRVNAFSAGVNYWASRHLRLSINYALSMFPSSEPATPTTSSGPAWSSAQRAVAPGNTLDPGVNDSARDGAHSLHELSTRVGLAF